MFEKSHFRMFVSRVLPDSLRYTPQLNYTAHNPGSQSRLGNTPRTILCTVHKSQSTHYQYKFQYAEALTVRPPRSHPQEAQQSRISPRTGASRADPRVSVDCFACSDALPLPQVDGLRSPDASSAVGTDKGLRVAFISGKPARLRCCWGALDM